MTDPKATAPPLTDADVVGLIEWPLELHLEHDSIWRLSGCTACHQHKDYHAEDCRQVQLNAALSELLAARQRERTAENVRACWTRVEVLEMAERAEDAAGDGHGGGSQAFRETARMLRGLAALLDAPSAEPKC